MSPKDVTVVEISMRQCLIYFCGCSVVKRCCTRVWTWYEALTDDEIVISRKFMSLNVCSDNVTTLDMVILIGKQYTFRCKCLHISILITTRTKYY